jgi:hypothetical protein
MTKTSQACASLIKFFFTTLRKRAMAIGLWRVSTSTKCSNMKIVAWIIDGMFSAIFSNYGQYYSIPQKNLLSYMIHKVYK